MKLFALSLALTGLHVRTVMAADWHTLTYVAPNDSGFLSFSGSMVAPTLPGAGTYYLWPGLQPTDNSGVYQNVLDGTSGSWWFGSGWCCSNPSLPWGGGFNVGNGDTTTFSNVKQSDGSWTSTVTLPSTNTSVTNNFALQGKTFNLAIFAIELDGPTWDFGPLAFKDVVIVSPFLLHPVSPTKYKVLVELIMRSFTDWNTPDCLRHQLFLV